MSTTKIVLKIRQEASKYNNYKDFKTYSPRTYRRTFNYKGMTNLIETSFHPNVFIKLVMIEKCILN